MEEDNDLKIKELLTRGVEEIIDKDNLEKRLKSGKELRIKLGIDPTRILGSATIYNKINLRQE